MGDLLRLAVLRAADGSLLWEVPLGTSIFRNGQLEVVDPPRTVDELRPVLEELLRQGHVRLYDLDDPARAPLAVTIALAIASDDMNWIPGRSKHFELVATDSGEAEYRRLSQRTPS